jgi:ASC-1-like (ASCH) protein
MADKTLWIKDEYLQLILSGEKRVEVRVAYSNTSRLRAGDRLLLNDRHPYRIRRLAHYPDFEARCTTEDPVQIAPGLPAGELRAIYPPEKEALGAVALELEPE